MKTCLSEGVCTFVFLLMKKSKKKKISLSSMCYFKVLPPHIELGEDRKEQMIEDRNEEISFEAVQLYEDSLFYSLPVCA